MRRYIKHLRRRCLTTFPNNSNFVKNTPLRVVISTFCSLFGNVFKHGLSCLVDYLKSDVVNGTNTDVQRIKCNLLHVEFTSEIFKIWITRKGLPSQKVLQTSQNKSNYKSSFAFHRRLCLWRFCTAAMLHEKNDLCTTKHFHCSCHVTWLRPCKTFIQHYIKQTCECVNQRLQNVVRTSV